MNIKNVAVAIVLASVCTLPVHAQSLPDAPRVVAVKFHADWCGYCQAMGRVFEELEEKHDTLPVLFVTLDLTREHNRRQSSFLAHGLGIGEIWRRSNGRTGFIALVNAETGALIGTLTHQQSLAEMGAALVAAVGTTAAP